MHLFGVLLMEPLDLAFYLMFVVITAISTAHHHPLDSLTATEITVVANVVKSSGHGTFKNLTFHYIGLDEPDKEKVLSWHLSDGSISSVLPPRRAFAIVRSERTTHEIVVDLDRRLVVTDDIYTGPGFPMYTTEEVVAPYFVLIKYKPFIESMRKRGLDMSKIVCGSVSSGWFGEVESEKRVSRVLCFSRGDTENLFAMPIEGLTIEMDIDEMRIVNYSDEEIIPVPNSGGSV